MAGVSLVPLGSLEPLTVPQAQVPLLGCCARQLPLSIPQDEGVHASLQGEGCYLPKPGIDWTSGCLGSYLVQPPISTRTP